MENIMRIPTVQIKLIFIYNKTDYEVRKPNKYLFIRTILMIDAEVQVIKY